MNVADWAVAFVMVQTVTEEGCWMVVYYKDEEDKGGEWQSTPLSVPPGSGKSRFGWFSMNLTRLFGIAAVPEMVVAFGLHWAFLVSR